MDRETRLKRLKFRAWHRGTKEADYMIGGYYDVCAAGWSDVEIDWFEALLDEEDVDIMALAIGTAAVPPRWQGALMERLQRIDYVVIPQ